MKDSNSNAFVFLSMGLLLAFVVKPWYIGLPFLIVGFIYWLDNNE